MRIFSEIFLRMMIVIFLVIFVTFFCEKIIDTLEELGGDVEKRSRSPTILS